MNKPNLSRRNFIGAGVAGVSAFTIVKPELVRGAGKEKIKVGLIGCGGRGTTAAWDLLSNNENVELVAVGDLFPDHVEEAMALWRDPKGKLGGVKNREEFPSILPKIKVDREHTFTGFDAYKKVIASDVDLVMLCTPPGYRPLHFEAAVNAKKHVFCEKPIAVDPVGVRRFLAAVEKSKQQKLTVVSGAQRHFYPEIADTIKKIHDGAIGDVLSATSWYLDYPVFHVDARDPKWSDMEYQNRNWYSFVWICGDQIVEQHFHNLDMMNWVMGTHPLKVVASGGAAWRPADDYHGNIYDHISSDFVYPNGVHFSSMCRQYPKTCLKYQDDLVVGTKGRSNCRDMGGTKGKVDVWDHKAYMTEHRALVSSIRGDGPYLNYGQMVAESTMTAIMGRESAYSGLEITWDQIMKSQLNLMPEHLDMSMKIQTRPRPVPGVYKFV
jgi:predicted dehydrogenase